MAGKDEYGMVVKNTSKSGEATLRETKEILGEMGGWWEWENFEFSYKTYIIYDNQRTPNFKYTKLQNF